MKRWVVLGLALFSAINLQAQEKVYFLGDSCFLVDPVRNEKADGVWLKFDQRKDQMQKWIEDGLLAIKDSTIESFFHNDFDNSILKYQIKDKHLHGKYEAFFPDTSLQETGEYNQGKKVGIWKTFNKKGVVVSQHIFDKTTFLLESTRYYNNGSPATQFIYFGFTKQLVLKIEWYKNGNISHIGSYTRSRRKLQEVGNHDYYDLDGQINQEKSPTGTCKINEEEKYKLTFHSNGQLAERIITWSGCQRRSIEKWYPDGKLESHGMGLVIAGDFIREGEWIFYSTNGYKSLEASFNQGAKQGFWTHYDKQGRLSKYEEYSQKGKLKNYTKILFPERDHVEFYTEIHYNGNGKQKKIYELRE